MVKEETLIVTSWYLLTYIRTMEAHLPYHRMGMRRQVVCEGRGYPQTLQTPTAVLWFNTLIRMSLTSHLSEGPH